VLAPDLLQVLWLCYGCKEAVVRLSTCKRLHYGSSSLRPHTLVDQGSIPALAPDSIKAQSRKRASCTPSLSRLYRVEP
jgi:hypothetical protein